jgi:hypothetical protein
MYSFSWVLGIFILLPDIRLLQDWTIRFQNRFKADTEILVKETFILKTYLSPLYATPQILIEKMSLSVRFFFFGGGGLSLQKLTLEIIFSWAGGITWGWEATVHLYYERPLLLKCDKLTR